MDDLVKHVRWVHATLVIVLISLLLAIIKTSSSSSFDRALSEVEAIKQVQLWQKPGWFENSSLEKLGITPSNFVPTLVNFSPRDELTPFSSMWAKFERLINVPKGSFDETYRTKTIDDFFEYWDSLLNPVEVLVFVQPDYQRKRFEATSRYIANESEIRPIFGPFQEGDSWFRPDNEYISDIDIEFLFDRRNPTHPVVITFDEITPGRLEDTFVMKGQTRALFEVKQVSKLPFFMQNEISIPNPFAYDPSRILDNPTGFEISFISEWEKVLVVPQEIIVRQFPYLYRGKSSVSFSALNQVRDQLGMDVEIELFEGILRYLADNDNRKDELSIFGISLPLNLVLFWAVPLLVAIQIYLSLYLMRLVQASANGLNSEDQIWIGLFDHPIAIIMTWSTICIMPALVSIIFVWRLFSLEAGYWPIVIISLSLLGIWASLNSAKSLWRIRNRD